MFRFANPPVLFALVLALLPIVAAALRSRWRKVPRLRYTETAALREIRPTLRVRIARFYPYLESGALALGILALARPQAGHRIEQVTTEGIDIVVALDVSGSMRAEDFAPKNRLYVARRTIDVFIEGRPSDRIGLITFSRVTETRCPPTLDHDALRASLEASTFADPRDDGTAIGSGIATATNRLRTSRAKSRVIILLTDGINNAGSIDPLTAAELAKAVGVKIHAVGVGSEGPVIVPLPDGSRTRALLPINEQELKAIASTTGGRYFRATDTQALAEIFKTIDGMEKTKMEVLSYGRYDERFAWFLGPALALLAGGLALSSTLLARIP